MTTDNLTKAPKVFDSYEEGQYAFLVYWAKGHWSIETFKEGIERCFGDDPRLQRCKNYRQTFGRFIPDRYIGLLLHCCKNPGRGAFPITILEP